MLVTIYYCTVITQQVLSKYLYEYLVSIYIIVLLLYLSKTLDDLNLVSIHSVPEVMFKEKSELLLSKLLLLLIISINTVVILITCTCLKKNLNSSRPSEHPPVREENVKRVPRWLL